MEVTFFYNEIPQSVIKFDNGTNTNKYETNVMNFFNSDICFRWNSVAFICFYINDDKNRILRIFPEKLVYLDIIGAKFWSGVIPADNPFTR